MTLSELKSLVQRLEENAGGIDCEVLFYDMIFESETLTVAEATKKLKASEMRFENTFMLPME